MSVGLTPNNKVSGIVRSASGVVLSFLLMSCQTGQISQPAPVKTANQSPKAEAVNTLSFKEIIGLLEQGQPQAAKKALQNLLRTQPNNASAKRLLAVISENPTKLYGTRFFDYRVKKGETLGQIAEKFLGRSWEYYGLARFNELGDPRNLRAGQVLRIPDISPIALSPENLLDRIAALIEEKQFIAAARLTITSRSLYQKESEAKQLLRRSLKLHAEQASLGNRLRQAKAEASALGNENIISSLAESLERSVLYYQWLGYVNEANTAVKKQQFQNAQQAFKAARALNFAPTDDYNLAKKAISESYHRDAVVRFRNQQLVEAVSLWDLVLDIDPDHSSAANFRTRALKLIEQLENIQ